MPVTPGKSNITFRGKESESVCYWLLLGARKSISKVCDIDYWVRLDSTDREVTLLFMGDVMAVEGEINGVLQGFAQDYGKERTLGEEWRVKSL